MEQTEHLPDPKWTIIGYESGGFYWAAGSDDLTKASLTAAIKDEYPLVPFDKVRVPPRRTFTFTTEVGSFALACGRSWAEALGTLLGTWTPPHTAASEIPNPFLVISESGVG